VPANGVLLDHDISTVIYDPTGSRLLSIPEIKADIRRLTDRAFRPERQHGWLISGLHRDDAPGVYTLYGSAAYLPGYAGPAPAVHLRRGETLRRYLQPGLEDGKTFVYWGRNYNRGGRRPGARPHLGQPTTTKCTVRARGGRRPASARPATATPSTRTGRTSRPTNTAKASSTRVTATHLHVCHALPDRRDATHGEPWGIHEPGCTNGLVLRGRASCPVAVSVDDGAALEGVRIRFRDGLDLTDHVKAQRQYRLRYAAGGEGTGRHRIDDGHGVPGERCRPAAPQGTGGAPSTLKPRARRSSRPGRQFRKQ